jgi:hypothetical protein
MMKKLKKKLLKRLFTRYPITRRVNRVVTRTMIALGLWKHEINLFNLLSIKPQKAKWLHTLMLKYQQVDNLKHAPCCPANHYHRSRLVFQPCTCGANVEMRHYSL